jgi:hypothetical protein
MKTNRLFFPIVLGLASVTLVTFSAFESYKTKTTHNMGGTASECGSPGELGTCSRNASCHGAGASPAGVADNAGPGSVTITSIPAITGNQYIPGTVYAMHVTVSQTGKPRFGFACEILDNSGSTNNHINNTAGTVTVTDHINTRIWQAFATGRLAITHDTNGGFASNTYTFNFSWTAPAKGFGTVNVYLCGNAADGNLKADSGDYVYTQHLVWTEGVAASIQSIETNTIEVNAYPVPTNNQLTLLVNMPEAGNIVATLYSIDGKVAKELDNCNVLEGAFIKTYSVNDMAKGMYFMEVKTGKGSIVKRIIIN